MSRGITFSIISFFFLFPLSVLGGNPLDVVINEIAWMGTQVEGVESKNWWRYEWVELYNNTNQIIDLSNWEIENAGSSGKTLKISQGEIPPQGYFLICKKELDFCNFISWSLSLNNDYKENGKLVLKDGEEKIIDQTPEPENKNWPAGDNETKQTMERIKIGRAHV